MKSSETKKKCPYVERDISWMYFNQRILLEAARPEVPLLERLTFLGIYSNNLDEFFRVRVATLNRIIEYADKNIQKEQETATRTLKQISKLHNRFYEQFEKTFASIMEELKKETRTMIVYEAPHHLVATLEDLYGALGNRKITICRELTKKFESAFQTTFEEALAHYETEEPKGECVIVIAGKPVEEIREEEIRAWEEMPIEEHMEHYLSQGMDKKEAMKAVAKDRGISKRDVYQQLL
mgnify:CR=1 FL=1